MSVKATVEVIKALKQARAEGKPLNEWARMVLAEAEAKEKIGGGKTKLAAALYLLGGSLRQVGAKLEITVSTAYTYVRDHVPEKVREIAGKQRDHGRSGPLITHEAINAYCEEFALHPEWKALSAVEIAAKLKTTVTVTPPISESLEDASDEPY